MLMQKGADVSGHVITDPDADKPPVKADDETDGLQEEDEDDYDDWYIFC